MINKINLKLYGTFAVIIMLSLTGCKTDAPSFVQVPKQIIPPPSVVVAYNVEPEKLIRDNYGYIGTKYFTHKQEIEKIKTRLDKKKAAEEDYEKAYKRVPDFGNIVIHIGRQDLMHANTKLYRFSVKKGNRYLLDFVGKEGIPNIKGSDGNWWNIVKLPLREEIEDKLSVEVRDLKTNTLYSYSITKTEKTE